MNNKIIDKVTALAIEMIAMAEAENVEMFEKLYQELQLICTENETGPGNHPVQWETLADFTQDVDDSIAIYKKALAVAEKLKEHQYAASIQYAIAERYSVIDNKKEAILHANKAKLIADKMDDAVLTDEIDELLAFLAE